MNSLSKQGVSVMSPGIFRMVFALIVLIYLGQGFFYARTLVSWDDESSYLALGYLAVKGEISLYQDELTGQRMPLPFYLLGASQLAFGPNLLAGRLLSVALGLGTLALTVAVARRLEGDWAGVLAGLFLATQGTIVGYYATATYHSLTATILLGAVWVLLNGDLPWRGAWGMGVASLLFLTRTNVFPALPFFCVWALVQARGLGERLTVLMLAVALPAAFFLSDATHVKLLAHVPILNRLVEPLGYGPILELSARAQAGFREQLWGLVVFVRRYESWTVALAGLVLAGGLLRCHGRRLPRSTRSREVTALAILCAWLLLWHFVIFRVNFKIVPAYFPTFAPLLAILLGIGVARLWELGGLPRPVLLAWIAVVLTVSVVFIRQPLMPRPVPMPFRQDAIQRLDRAALGLRGLVPQHAPVFLFAQPMVPYLAGLRPYLQQMMAPQATLAPVGSDPWMVRRSGVWGPVELERWLGEEAQYALISPGELSHAQELRPESVGRIRELLRERFQLVSRVDDAPWSVYEVYRRRVVRAVPVRSWR